MGLSKKVLNVIHPVVISMGYELVGVEHLGQGKHSVLRVYIDRADGIAVGDCEQVSRQISALLDVEDPIPGQYSLEVSSPGLDRPLFNKEHYIQFIGSQCKVRLYRLIDGRRRITGVITGVTDDNVVIESEGEALTLSLEMIEKANLVPEIQF